MNRSCPTIASDFNDGLGVKVTFPLIFAFHAIRFIGHAYVVCIGIDGRVNGTRANAESVRGLYDATGNLASIGDEDFHGNVGSSVTRILTDQYGPNQRGRGQYGPPPAEGPVTLTSPLNIVQPPLILTPRAYWRTTTDTAPAAHYSGIFPCFFGGFLALFPSRLRSAAISFGRVARGGITSSI